MPIFNMPPIHTPTIINLVKKHERRDTIESLKAQVIRGVLNSNKGFVLIKIGTYTIDPIKFNYDISREDCCRVDVEVGKIGIATKVLMSQYFPLTEGGELYLFATNDPKAKLLDDEVTSVRMY